MPPVVVVGAGSAGAIVATRLAQRGTEVLLLEAGPDFPADPPALLTSDVRVPVLEHDWGYRSEGDREIDLPRGKVVGGSSATNAVAAIRPQPADLDGWGIPEWSWDACLPALSRFETDREFGHEPYHGDDGPVHVERIDLDASPAAQRAVLDAFVDFGIEPAPDQNAPRAHGAGAQMSNTRDGVRQSTLVTFMPIARTLPSFRLRADATVDRLAIVDQDVTGVVLTTGEVIEADQVILAAGVFGSPMILMRSGIGPADHLRDLGVDAVQDLPVGVGLQDHPALGLLAMSDGPLEVDRALYARVMARHSFDGRAGEEDVHLFGPFTAEGVRSPIPDNGFVIAGFTTRPKSQGWVRLRSADPDAPPRVTLNYFAEPDDLEMFIRMMLTIEELLLQPSVQKIAPTVPWRPSREKPEELRRAARAGALTDHHESGTCKIGEVVDAHLRVQGIGGLRVCDASVLPDTPRCNTNFPTMMVAERFVELLDAE